MARRSAGEGREEGEEVIRCTPVYRDASGKWHKAEARPAVDAPTIIESEDQ